MENQHYAGFWLRFLAFLIDMVVITLAFGIPLTFIYGVEYWSGTQVIRGFWDVMLSYVLPFIATIWFWQRFLGTPGKMLLRLRIVDARTGHKPSLAQSVGRYFAYLVSMLPFMLGFIWIGIDQRKQGFHDKLAGTVVVRESHGKLARPEKAADDAD